MQKIRNVFEFYKSTLIINIGISIGGFLLGGLASAATIFLVFGFVVSIAIKEVTAKNEYLFYSNNGLSKIKLWISSYAIHLIIVLFLWIGFKVITEIL